MSEKRHGRHCAPPHSRLHSTETHRQAQGQIHSMYFQTNTTIFRVHSLATLIRKPVYPLTNAIVQSANEQNAFLQSSTAQFWSAMPSFTSDSYFWLAALESDVGFC